VIAGAHIVLKRFEGLLEADNLRLATTLGVFARILNSLGRFISVPLAIALLSKDGYGLWLVITSFTAWIALADFGLPSALQNQLISLRAQSRFDEAHGLVRYAAKIFVFLGLGVAICGLLLVGFLPFAKWVNAPQELVSQFNLALAGSLVLAGALFIVRMGPALAYAHRKPIAPAVAEIFATVTSLATLFLLYLNGWNNLGVMVVVTLAGQVFGVFFLTVWMFRQGGYLTAESNPCPDNHRKELFGKGGFFFVNVIGELLVLQSLILIISRQLGPAAVAAFALPMIIFNNTLMLQAIALRGVVPRVRHHFELGEVDAANRLIRKSFVLCMAFGLVIAIGTIIAGDWFLRIWTGGHVGLQPVMAWGIAFLIIVASVDNPCTAVLLGLDGVRERSVLTVGYGLLQSLLAWFLLPEFGVNIVPWVGGCALLVAALFPGLILLRSRCVQWAARTQI